MKHLIMGTAGHVDHGKTALIKALTNIDCDTHKEEKRRGITINLGFSYLNLPSGESIGIIDVPGHKDFVNTMVSGACGIDFVLLVIAADSGIMPQTKEHVNIVSALGIKHGIVALTKTDLVDEELVEMAKLEIMEFLNSTSLKDIPIVGVSSLNGNGINELKNSIKDILPQISERNKSNLFRMYIDRTFTVKGIGTVVTGTVLNGSLKLEEEIILLPNSTIHRVKSIERHSCSTDFVIAGDRAAIQLAGVKKEDIQRGAIISDKEIDSTILIDASISLFDPDFKINNWSIVTFHSGTFECQARMHKLYESGKNILVQLHLDKTSYLLNHDKFIIRNSSGDKTLGGGIIIDNAPLNHRKITPNLVDSLKLITRNIDSENHFFDSIIIELKKNVQPITIEHIAHKLDLKTIDIRKELNNKPDDIQAFSSNNIDILIYKEYDTHFRNKVIDLLNNHHSENYLSELGLTTIELIGKLGLTKVSCAKEYTNQLLLKLGNENIIDLQNNTWVLKGKNPTIDNKTLDDIHWLENEFLKFDFQKPDFKAIEEKATIKKISRDKLKKYLNYLTGKNKLISYNNEYFHSEIAKKIKTNLIEELSQNTDGMDMDDFRQKFGVSKRLIPLLISYFESQKLIITRKTGLRVQILMKK